MRNHRPLDERISRHLLRFAIHRHPRQSCLPDAEDSANRRNGCYFCPTLRPKNFDEFGKNQQFVSRWHLFPPRQTNCLNRYCTSSRHLSPICQSPHQEDCEIELETHYIYNDNSCLRKEIRIIIIITPKNWCCLKQKTYYF